MILVAFADAVEWRSDWLVLGRAANGSTTGTGALLPYHSIERE